MSAIGIVLVQHVGRYTVYVGAADTACINGDIDIVLFECLQLELFLVERLPSVT